MYYIGFLKKDAEHAMVFKSVVSPKKGDYTYFVKIIGPYPEKAEADMILRNFKAVGWHDNPVVNKKRIKNIMSPEKALRLTRKVISYAKDLHKEYKSNPGVAYHDKKFLFFMRELEKYKIGSPPYISTLAKAYEHLESAKDSKKEKVR